MSDRSIVICGLPASGKTTFLAALWHLVSSGEIRTAMRFGSLKYGDYAHLNKIATTWRAVEEQVRTELTPLQLVTMNLIDSNDRELGVTFPDLSGEVCRLMWEERHCRSEDLDVFRSSSGVALFIHADNISMPYWLVEEIVHMLGMGVPLENRQSVPWKPEFAPTQVKLVEILQMLHSPPLDVGPRRVAVILSAWDKVSIEQKHPEEFLAARMPLLHQYLRSGADGIAWRVYGVSAQGGDLETEAEVLRREDVASKRIHVVFDDTDSHDLTEPLLWLMS